MTRCQRCEREVPAGRTRYWRDPSIVRGRAWTWGLDEERPAPRFLDGPYCAPCHEAIFVAGHPPFGPVGEEVEALCASIPSPQPRPPRRRCSAVPARRKGEPGA